MTTQTKTTAPARRGRERTCTQCGRPYRSPRRSSFCGNACRMKAKRGTLPCRAPEARPTNAADFSPIGKALVLLGYAGPIGPTDRHSRERPTFGLTVPYDMAFAELRALFDRKRWGALTENEFSHALTNDGIARYRVDSAETLFRRRSAALAVAA